MRYQPATYPETIPQVVKRAWNLYLCTFSKVFTMGLVVAILDYIPAFIVIGTIRGIFTLVLPPVAFGSISVISTIISLTIFLGILWRLQCVTTNTHESLIKDFAVAFRHLLLVIFAALIEILLFYVIYLCTKDFFILFGSFGLPQTGIQKFLFGIPVIIAAGLCVLFLFLFIFYLPLILTENKNPIRALLRSMELVWGNWWRTFWATLTPWFAYVLFIFVVKSIMHFIPYFAIRPSFLRAFIFMIIYAIYLPWFAATLLVQLHDLELRHKVAGPRLPKVIKKRAKRK